MTSIAQLRKAAAALPEVAETTHFGMVAFTVRGKGFASVRDQDVLQLQLTDEDAERALAEHPSAERILRAGKPIGIAVPLAEIDGQQLNALVREAWFARAPKRLAAAQAEAAVAEPGEVGDLPAAIGRPATRALAAAGLTTLDRIAEHSEGELLAMHGVGPKAVRILVEELAARGRSLS